MNKSDYLENYSIEYALDAWKRYLEKDSNAIVLSDSLGTDLTRSQVDELSGKVYAWLVSQNIGKDDFVLINLDRGVKPVIAVIGVLKCGAAFSITESNYAKERTDFIRTDCQAKIEINENNWPEIVNIEPLKGFVRVDNHDVCFAVYTSGTTGTPKGVLHEYGQMVMEMLSERRADGSWRENEMTRWGLVAPLNFVASLKIFFHFLYCGGHLYVMDYDTVKNARKLITYFLTHKINETFLSPSLIRLKKSGFGPYMKYIYTGAEPANNIFLKNVELNNTYTMSESLFTVTEYIIDKPYPLCPIGKPMFDLDIRLIDVDGNEVPEGTRGELCFYNPYCRGYINNPKENEAHFIDKYFHTGDLAVYQNGQYILKGRKDDMIKINGNRIEPAEIEAACQKLYGLKQCVAKGFQDKGTVVLYYVGKKEIIPKEAQKALEDILPYYMIPAFFVKMDKIPLNKSAKVDRKALAYPMDQIREPYVAPRNKIEKKLVEGIEKVLNVKNVGIDDDFFTIGGNSIKAIELIDYLEKKSKNNAIDTGLIYQGRTIRKIYNAFLIQNEGLSPEEKEVIGRANKIPLRHFSATIYPALKAFPEATTFNIYGGFKFKKRFFFTGKRFCAAINKTIKNNSQMLSVIREDENGNPYWAYAPECYPEIKLEKMNDQEAIKAADTFVQGFGSCMDKALYRFKIIESKHFVYVYSDFSHVLNDGYGLSLLAQDIISAFVGKVNKENRFYEWLYDSEEIMKSNYYRESDQYFNELYLPFVDKMHFINKGEEGNQFIKKMYPLKFDEAVFREHKRSHRVTNNVFLNTALICSLAEFNQRKDTGILWCYNGIDGKKNHSCFNAHGLPLALLKDRYADLSDLYADIGKQVHDGIKHGKFFFDYDGEFARQTKNLNVYVDYIADLESGAGLDKVGGEIIKLFSPHDEDIESNFIIAQILDSSYGFDLRLWHPVSELTVDNAKIFVKIIRNVIADLLTGNLPDYLRQDEQ